MHVHMFPKSAQQYSLPDLWYILVEKVYNLANAGLGAAGRLQLVQCNNFNRLVEGTNGGTYDAFNTALHNFKPNA